MNPVARWRERRRIDRELGDEMAAHLDEKVEDLMAEGKSEEEARRMAHVQFGNLTLERENSREAWGWNAFEQLARDVRFGCRMLAKTPGFTVIAIVVLALGIGMNTAIFSAVKAVLLSSLPYPEPDRLVEIWQTNRYGDSVSASGPDFRDWREQNRSLEHLATYDGGRGTLSGAFEARRIRIGVVSAGFFETLCVQAAIGRTFSKEGQRPGGTPTAIFGYALAQSVFGQAAQSIGKSVRVDGMTFTVIGVMPPRFDFPMRAQLWIPADFFSDTSDRSAHNYSVVARLKNGVSVKRAQQDMNVIAARLARTYPDDRGEGIRVVSLYDELVGPVRPALLILFAAVTLVLVIACVNISNFQVARATARLRELALRTALGASRRRLFRQLLTESFLLSIVGGVAGMLLSIAATAALRGSAPASIPRLENMSVDMSILGFTAAVSIGAGVLFGVLPAMLASRVELNEALKTGGGKSTDAPQLKRWGNTLVIAQIALAVVLLSGASLLMRSYWKLSHVDSGLKSFGVLTADLSWPTADGNSVNGPQVARLSSELLERVRALPGIQAAALIQPLPVRSAGSNGSFEIEGRPLPADPHQYPDAFYRLATGSYFEAFGLPILTGRTFNARDDHSSNQAAVVNQSFARKFFPAQNVLGKRIRFFGFDAKPQFMTIVGVVPDVRAFGLDKPANAEVFVDYLQHAGFSLDVTLLMRGPASERAALRSLITSINRDTPVEFQSMDEVISGSIAPERFQTVLLGLFAAFALLLSVV